MRGEKLDHCFGDDRASTKSVAWSPDGSRLAGGSFSPKIKERVRIWDLASGSLVRALDEIPGIIGGLAWSPDGRWLAAGFSDGMVRIWDAESGKQDQVLEDIGRRAILPCIAGGWGRPGCRGEREEVAGV
jgi:WD40 repeat protein